MNLNQINDNPFKSRLAAMTGSASSDREIMVAEIDVAAAAINGCYEELSPVAKAQTVILAHALAGLRQRMVTPNDGAEACCDRQPTTEKGKYGK